MSYSNEGSTEFLQRPGGRVAFDVSGTSGGPLVVCIPGMGDVRSTYRHLLVPLVDAGYRVACMDLRGHGDSDATFDSFDDAAAASDAVALIEALDGPAVVIGNSMGAGAAVVAAANRPELVVSLVLIGPFVRNAESSAVVRWGMRIAMAGPWSTRVWVSYLPALYPSRRGEDFEQHRRVIAASMRRPGNAAAFRHTTRTDHALAWEAAQNLDVSTLVVMGGKDPDFSNPAAEASLIASTLGGTVLMIPNAGHYPQSEFPEVTSPVVVEFISHTVPRG